MDYVRLVISIASLAVAAFTYFVAKRAMTAAREIESKTIKVTQLSCDLQTLMEVSRKLLIQQLTEAIQRQDRILVEMDRAAAEMQMHFHELVERTNKLEQRAKELGV